MSRWHIGVAVLAGGRVGVEVQALRRALGDPDLEVIGPHVTLVPPVKLREPELATALAMVRAAARSTAPFAVGLDPPATFAPVSPTVHLPVVDDGRLLGLHRALFRPPLWRETHPYVAHLSLVATATEEQIAGSLSLLAGYRAELAVERLTVLVRTDRPRRWRTLTDVDLDGVRTVGAGLLAVELVAGTALEPAARALLPAEEAPPAPSDPTGEDVNALAITAYREGAAVGAALGSPADDAPATVVVAPDARRQGVGRLLRQEWLFRADQRRATPTAPPA